MPAHWTCRIPFSPRIIKNLKYWFSYGLLKKPVKISLKMLELPTSGKKLITPSQYSLIPSGATSNMV